MTKILLLLGGNWHDFEGYASAFRRYFSENAFTIEATCDADALYHLDENRIDLVALYTCLGGSNQHGRIAEDLKPDQVAALCRWVEAGGKVLGLHAATVMGESQTRLRRLLGGRFLSHPPQFDFAVIPMHRAHPITAGVGAFTVHDEFYIQDYDDTAEIHMVAFDRGLAHPMVWTKAAGQGHVAYLAPGHSHLVWDLPAYQQLVTQAVAWLTAPQPR
jgi:type 1 glutamine amidotransferase